MNLIPFGKDKTTGRLVDVSEVPKGEQCGCICPSCGNPLIARQGNKKEWHFAHKKEFQKGTHGPCKYSWFVSLRMMIRQILHEENELYVPEYKKYHPIKRQDLSVTQAHKLHYDKCITDVLEKGEHHSFDARLLIQEHRLNLFVSYKGREYRGYHHEQHVEGIIEIDLRSVTLRRQKQLTESSCVAQLRNMLKKPHPCKRWLYHKREIAIEENIRRDIAERKKQKAIEKAARRQQQKSQQSANTFRYRDNQTGLPHARTEPEPVAKVTPAPVCSVIEQTKPVIDHLQTNVPKSSPQIKTSKSKPESVKDQPFYCIVCKHEYMGAKEGRNPCPLCNEHLYRRAL